ncbi:phosphotransferase family protein [Geomicrobium sp. JSM 1781026]|uniref:phosphotransferase family protein n=1 Tax=Geomicrobium sp. JSM 1781026 TaxID=3344580 RepID=UPI0035C0D706
MSAQNETIAVRPGEGLDVSALSNFLTGAFDKFPADEPLVVTQFPAGASNLTYLLECGSFEAVLRRPPFGPLPAKGHDMKREYQFLKALSPVFSYAPKPFVIGEDTEVMDATFYVMERKRGVVVDKRTSGVQPTAEQARNISEMFVRLLADLHRVDPTSAGLDAFGRPEGFMERQVKSWIQRFERVKTEDELGYERLKEWMLANIVTSGEATVIHNDFKLNNLLFSTDLSGIEAVVDWEMATVGDPLFDLGVALSYWTEAGDSPRLQNGFKSVTTNEGFFTRNQFIERYEQLTGRNCDDILFYQVFAYFKLAVIVQQIYYRWKVGQTEDERFKMYGPMAGELIKQAVYMMEGEKKLEF